MKKSSSLPGRTPSRLRCMKLEQRILFDGAAAAEVVAADAAASVPLESALPAEVVAPAPLVEAPVADTAASPEPAVVAEATVAPGEAAAAQENLAEPVADSASASPEADALTVADTVEAPAAPGETVATAADTTTALTGQDDVDPAGTTDQTELATIDANLANEDSLVSSDALASAPLVEATSVESAASLDTVAVTQLDTDLAAASDIDHIDGDLTALASQAVADAPEIPVDQAQTAIRDYLATTDADTLFTLFNGDQAEPTADWLERAETLRQSWLAGEDQTPVELLDDATMQGALGAFAAQGPLGTPVIYLNQDWMTRVADTPEVVRVLVEELGHSIDHALNPDGDTAGDEGQRFAAAVLPDLATESIFAQDTATLLIDGRPVEVELATYTFSGAYRVLTDRTPAEKEANTHDFDFNDPISSITIVDGGDSRYFSGNDVSATCLEIAGTNYYGWISRPIKVNGVTRGFYFWTDTNFTSLALAQADGNRDKDGTAVDNSGFILVVDQAYFDSLLPYTSTTIKNVNSSSDRVDNTLNALIPPEPELEAVADSVLATEDNALPETGNVIANDIGEAAKTVTSVGTSSANQSVTTGTTSTDGTQVVGQYGTLQIGADGSYTYTVNNNLPAVEALLDNTTTLNDAFTYTITDANGLQASTTLTVTVQGTNDAPAAANDYNTAKESLLDESTGAYTEADPLGSRAVGNVLGNDTDVDQYGEEKWIVGVSETATATGTGVSGATTVTFATKPDKSITTQFFVYLDGDTINNDDQKVANIKCLSINSHDLVQDNHSGRQCVECNVREIRLLVSWYQFAKSVEP